MKHNFYNFFLLFPMFCDETYAIHLNKNIFQINCEYKNNTQYYNCNFENINKSIKNKIEKLKIAKIYYYFQHNLLVDLENLKNAVKSKENPTSTHFHEISKKISLLKDIYKCDEFAEYIFLVLDRDINGEDKKIFFMPSDAYLTSSDKLQMRKKRLLDHLNREFIDTQKFFVDYLQKWLKKLKSKGNKILLEAENIPQLNKKNLEEYRNILKNI